MRDDPVASERRRQLANMVCIVLAFCAVRGLLEACWVYTTRQGSGESALTWTLPSWILLPPLATCTVGLAARFRAQRAHVHEGRVPDHVQHVLVPGHQALPAKPTLPIKIVAFRLPFAF